MEFGVFVATKIDDWQLLREAEALGYDRAWVPDSQMKGRENVLSTREMVLNTPRPTGTVTFLFTDIEGSTRRWEAEPDVMRGALAVHDEVLRVAIDARGGWLFMHTGDGVCAAFRLARYTNVVLGGG